MRMPDAQQEYRCGFACLALLTLTLSGCETFSIAEFDATPKVREKSGHTDNVIVNARLLVSSGQRDQATALLISHLKEFPRDVAAIELLAETAGASGDWRLQHASLMALAAEFPNSGTIQHRTGLALLQAVRLRRAQAGGPDAKSTKPMVRQSTQDALKMLARAVELQPREVRFAQDYAAARVDDRQYEKARDILARAMQQNP